MRDVLMFGVGAVAGAAALGLVGMGLQGDAAPPPATEAAAEDARGAAPGPFAAVTAILGADDEPTLVASGPGEPTACFDASAPPPGGAVLWGEDGPEPCDAACVRGFVEAALAPGATDEDVESAFQVSSQMAALIAEDDGLRRAYLRQLSGLTVPDPMDPEARYDPRVSLLTTVAMSGQADLALAASERLLASADPFTRAAGVHALAAAAYEEPRAAAQLEEVVSREPEGPALVSAIHSLHAVGDQASARTKARLRDLARSAEDPEIRVAAIQHVGTFEPEAAASLIQEAEASSSAMVRLGALQMQTWDYERAEAETERLRAAAQAIADDPDADPEARMGALGLLTYELTDRPSHDHYH